MNRRLTDKLEIIRAPLAVAAGILLGWIVARYYPLVPPPHVEHCRAPQCVIVTLPDCDAVAAVTRYRGQDAVRVECKP